MDKLEEYRKYRKELVSLHSKILKLSSINFKQSVTLLDILEGKDIVLESGIEKDAILDFNVYRKIKNEQNAASLYREQENETNEKEAILLSAMEKADGLLYEIVKINKEKNSILLKEAENDTEAVEVIDVGLSETLNKNTLIFARLIHLSQFSLTSGMEFLFLKEHKHYLKQRSRKLMKKINSGNISDDRFIAYFKLNRTDGLPAFTQEIT
ncbi:hypothetical protein [Sporolactobacillus nakayamae]|uniref:Uncharacterized protein n=1 Tax=Sporolactobacillus nakayamae TaxID=269670 RepID=A0A1I2UR04_9BACL|nr:hypothetical protein [Sporolactobacillus nakayamae]SFG79554.1 hypothetical protein SAMN02982927_02801 [Sporolactobacillus nakayamae]